MLHPEQFAGFEQSASAGADELLPAAAMANVATIASVTIRVRIGTHLLSRYDVEIPFTGGVIIYRSDGQAHSAAVAEECPEVSGAKISDQERRDEYRDVVCSWWTAGWNAGNCSKWSGCCG